MSIFTLKYTYLRCIRVETINCMLHLRNLEWKPCHFEWASIEMKDNRGATYLSNKAWNKFNFSVRTWAYLLYNISISNVFLPEKIIVSLLSKFWKTSLTLSNGITDTGMSQRCIIFFLIKQVKKIITFLWHFKFIPQ